MVRAAPSSVSAESAGAAVPTRPLGAAWETSGWIVQLLSSSAAARRMAALVDRTRLGLVARAANAESRPGRPPHSLPRGLPDDLEAVPDTDQLPRRFELVL